MPNPTNNPLFDNAPGGPNEPRLPDTITAFLSLISQTWKARASDPTFDNRLLDNSLATQSEQDGVIQVQKVIQDRLKVTRPPRAQQFLPYLLVRSMAPDNGTRPIVGSTISSPDIWIAQGDPSSTPEIPPDQGPDSVLGRRVPGYTIYAHVWNLGRAPIVGVKVEFYLNEGYGDLAPPVPAKGGPFGVVRIDLPPRSSLACHKLVKCPQVWTPDPIGLHYLIVRVSAIGDSMGNNPWDPSANRHVAVRKINVYTFVEHPVGS